MPAKALPLDNMDDAIKLYESGDGGYQRIARDLGVSHKVLRTRLAGRGTLRDQRTANIMAHARGDATRIAQRALPEQAICEAYVTGASENALAKEHGVTRAVIRRTLLRYGIERRDNTSANQLMMSARTPEENARNAEAAHEAWRGHHLTAAQAIARVASGAYCPTLDQLCERAQRRQGTVPTVATELLYAAWLRLRGIDVIHQHAIGPYNCDLTAEPVAMEIFGGNWHGSGQHAATFTERAQYILDQGWLLVIIWVDQAKQILSEASADYLAALIQQARSDPSMRGQYRVIWGDGQVVPTAGRDLHEFAAVPPRGSSRKTA